MKIGDRVKVLYRKTWKLGWILDINTDSTIYNVGFGETLSCYKEKEFERHDVKSYKKQSDDEHNSIIERDIPIGLSLANAALSDLLPGEKVVLKDGILYGYYDAVSISPTQYDQPTISGLIERTGWEVERLHFRPSTRWEPEDCDLSTVGTFPIIEQAVSTMIETIFKLKCNDYWTGKGEEAQAKAWAENEM